MSTNIHILKTCEYCGLEFAAKTTVTRFCSQRCRTKMYKKNNKNSYQTIENQNLCNFTISTYSPFDYLTIKEASTLLGCARSTIYDMIKKESYLISILVKEKLEFLRKKLEGYYIKVKQKYYLLYLEMKI